jgi:YbbR domain-containing protein
MQLPGVLTRNVRLKALAVVLALISWVAVVYAANPPESRTVSVHVPQDAALPGNYVLAAPIPNVDIRVTGTRDHVNAFDPATLTVSADVRHISHPGIQQLPLSVVNHDRDVDLDNPPTTVTADIDRQASVEVAVKLVITGTPPAGYALGKQTVSPATVFVTGPSRQLQGIRIEARVNLSNRKVTFGPTPVLITVLDSQGKTVTNLGVSVSQVEVTVPINSVAASRSSSVTPQWTGQVARGFQLVSITAKPFNVVISGNEDQLNGLNTIDTQPISVAGLSSNQTVTVNLAPPPGITATPDTVVVSIVVAPFQTATPTPAPSPTPTAPPTPTPTAHP